MKILNTIVAVAALSALTITTAQARDSYGLSISIGTHGYSHGHRQHHGTVHTHNRYRAAPIIYYGAPRVIYYEPRVVYRHRPYRSYRHYESQDYGYKHYDHRIRHKKHARKHHKRQHRKHNYYRKHDYYNHWR